MEVCPPAFRVPERGRLVRIDDIDAATTSTNPAQKAVGLLVRPSFIPPLPARTILRHPVPLPAKGRVVELSSRRRRRRCRARSGSEISHVFPKSLFFPGRIEGAIGSLSRPAFARHPAPWYHWSRRRNIEMDHRHLEPIGQYTLAAIDDTIDRGGRADWRALRLAAGKDPSVMERIRKVCAVRARDDNDQKFHLWRLYAG